MPSAHSALSPGGAASATPRSRRRLQVTAQGQPCSPALAAAAAGRAGGSPIRHAGQAPAPGTPPGQPTGRIPQRRSSLLSASHRTCSSSPRIRPYSDCEPPRSSLRRAVKPHPCRAAPAGWTSSGKAALTRANSAAAVRLTSRRPHPHRPARHSPGKAPGAPCGLPQPWPGASQDDGQTQAGRTWVR